MANDWSQWRCPSFHASQTLAKQRGARSIADRPVSLPHDTFRPSRRLPACLFWPSFRAGRPYRRTYVLLRRFCRQSRCNHLAAQSRSLNPYPRAFRVGAPTLPIGSLSPDSRTEVCLNPFGISRGETLTAMSRCTGSRKFTSNV